MIIANNIVKTYPGKIPVAVLRGVSLEIRRGEFVAIMGRSGSGKSTLLHELGLIDTPDSGAISIDGSEVLRLSESQKTRFRLERLGYIFQEFALVTELTALENVCLPAMTQKNRAPDYRKRAQELLDLVGLEGRLNHLPCELSGGEQQRVAVARALINRPVVLFADEPTANLDSASSKQVLQLFHSLNRQFGQTIVMVTHEEEDRKLVDRVVRLSDGRIVEKENAEGIPGRNTENRDW